MPRTNGPFEFRATHRYARITDRKARRLVDQIRGRSVNQALTDLTAFPQRAAVLVHRVLASAVANAMQNPAVKASRLVVTRAWVDGGPLLQGRLRFRPGPMGRAMPIRKKTCHIHVFVGDPEAEGREPQGEE